MASTLYNTDGSEVPYGFDVLMKTRDVAAICQVDPRTVTKWANEGRLYAVKLAHSGHRRYPEECVRALLAGDKERAASKPTGEFSVVHVSED